MPDETIAPEGSGYTRNIRDLLIAIKALMTFRVEAMGDSGREFCACIGNGSEWDGLSIAAEDHAGHGLALRIRLGEAAPAAAPDPPLPPADGTEVAPGGRFMTIAFFGRIEHTGYVTEVLTHGGIAAYHIDLPEKLWGGNPMAWREYAASAYFESSPLTEESVRAAWESARRRQAELQRRRDEMTARTAIEAPGDDLDDDDPYERTF